MRLNYSPGGERGHRERERERERERLKKEKEREELGIMYSHFCSLTWYIFNVYVSQGYKDSYFTIFIKWSMNFKTANLN